MHGPKLHEMTKMTKTNFLTVRAGISSWLNQGSTLTFQLTSLVASDKLDVTSQKNFLLAKRWRWLGPITAELLARLESTKQATPFKT